MVDGRISRRFLSQLSSTFVRINICLLEVNNKNARKRYEVCLKLTIKDQNDVNDVVLVSEVFSIADFEQVNTC